MQYSITDKAYGTHIYHYKQRISTVKHQAYKNIKQSRYKPGVAQSFPGS